MSGTAENEASYPLAWPMGWPRAKSRGRAVFGTRPSPNERMRSLTVAEARARLERELERLGGRHPVLSTNLRQRLDGRPYAGAPEPEDRGAAVYFTLRGRRTVLACDRWDRVADNIAAIAAHVEALRGIERWGVGTIEQAFRGYLALEDLRASVPWRRVFGMAESATPSLEQVEAAYRHRAREAHPDRGGSHEAIAELNQAIAAARRELQSLPGARRSR